MNQPILERLEDRLLLTSGLSLATPEGLISISGPVTVYDLDNNPITPLKKVPKTGQPINGISRIYISDLPKAAVVIKTSSTQPISLGEIDGNTASLSISAREIYDTQINVTNLPKLQITGNLLDSYISSGIISSFSMTRTKLTPGTLVNTRIEAGTLGKTKLQDIVDSEIISSGTITSIIAGNVSNTDIISGIDSVNGIYGDSDDQVISGVKYHSIGSINLSSLSADSSHIVMGNGSFPLTIGTSKTAQKITGRLTTQNYNGITIKTLTPKLQGLPRELYSYNVLSDIHTIPDADIVDITAANNPSFVITTGDNVHPFNIDCNIDWQILQNYMTPIAQESQIYYFIGNHDKRQDPDFSIFEHYSGIPTTYSFATDYITHIEINSNLSYLPGSQEYITLEQQLENANTPFIVVYPHYTSFESNNPGKYFMPLLKTFDDLPDKEVAVVEGHYHKTGSYLWYPKLAKGEQQTGDGLRVIMNSVASSTQSGRFRNGMRVSVTENQLRFDQFDTNNNVFASYYLTV